MTDKNGISVETGDIMLEQTGDMFSNGEHIRSCTIWAVPKIRDGRGIVYTYKGEETYFYWASARDSEKLDIAKLPAGFVFAFYHGLDKININNKDLCGDIYASIDKSDWEENALTPVMVEKLNTVSKIELNSFVDVAKNFDVLFVLDIVPPDIVNRILALAQHKRAIASNGEIGIAMLQDHMVFQSIYSTLREWKEKGTLLEYCMRLDKKAGLSTEFP